MFSSRVVTLSIATIVMAAIVGGCASSTPPASDVPAANAEPTATASSVPQTTPLPSPVATQAPVPAPIETPVPVPSPITTEVPAVAPSLVALPKLSMKVAGATKVKYFPIVGQTPGALVTQIVAKSAAPCKSKAQEVLACVLQRSSVNWKMLTNRASGSCTIVAATINRTSTVNLPRWVGPSKVQPELLTWWKPVLDHFAWHEGQHIKIQKTYEKKLKTQLVGHRCSSAKSIIKKWERAVDAAQDKFDAKDLSWQPYSVPYAGEWTAA